MRRRTWKRVASVTAISLLVISTIGLIYLSASGFTYYDNGQWIRTNLLAVYARSFAGYGTGAIEDRRLPPDWGSRMGYAARNFTLDLVGLDYSLPLSWEDIAAGPGLTVMRTGGTDRTAVALYPPGTTIKPGEKVTATIRLSDGNGTPPTSKATVHSVTLYRPRFSAVAYVVQVDGLQP